MTEDDDDYDGDADYDGDEYFEGSDWHDDGNRGSYSKDEVKNKNNVCVFIFFIQMIRYSLMIEIIATNITISYGTIFLIFGQTV